MSLFEEVLFNYPYDANDSKTVDKNNWVKLEYESRSTEIREVSSSSKRVRDITHFV